MEEEGADDCQDDVSVGSFHKINDVACGVEVPSLLLSPADFWCLAVYRFASAKCTVVVGDVVARCDHWLRSTQKEGFSILTTINFRQ